MKTKKLPDVAQGLYDRMSFIGCSQDVINTARWIISLFQNYCIDHDSEDSGIPEAVNFVRDCFGFDYYNADTDAKKAIRRPLLILFEFEETGTFFRHHPNPAYAEVPPDFEGLFLAYRQQVNTLNLAPSSQRSKLDVLVRHLKYLAGKGIEHSSDITPQCLYEYFESLDRNYSSQTIAWIKSSLRDTYDWMYDSGYIFFSGKAAIPYVKRDRRDKLISYYSKEEVDQILSCIDTMTSYGKCVYAIVCIIAHLGLRAGDVIRLKFSNIDWEHNRIHLVQQKTKEPLVLPMVDEVKYPLIDYIKNGRPDSVDKEYVFITVNSPHLRYHSVSAIHRMVTYCMIIAGIEFEGRHHGPHALRHSLATNLLNENVPLSSISSILGHKSTVSTEPYLTVDETHLKELALEVPHE